MARLSERFERIARGENRRSFTLLEREVATLLDISLADIAPDPHQPRKDLGDLDGLKASIAAYGILQPLIVSPAEDGKYRLIAGERRYTAAKALGLETVPALVRTVEEHERLELQLVENLNRKDLNPLEEAASYQRLISDYNLTQEELARRVGKSVASINQTLRVLTLTEAVKEEVQTTEHVSKTALLEIAKQPQAVQQEWWEQAKRGELTVKQARAQKPSSPRGRGKIQTSENSLSNETKHPQNRTFRYPIQTEEALVTVSFDKPHATFEEIVAALQQALHGEQERLQAIQGPERGE